jgi:hypothetical protein
MTTCVAGKWGNCSVQKASSDTCFVGNDDSCNGTANEGCDCTGFPLPNPAGSGLPNQVMYDTSMPDVVLDGVTGLMWQRKVPDGDYTQLQASAYCTTTVKGLGGFSDWRLPSPLELGSLVDTSSSDAINQAFLSVPASSASSIFWTDTPVVGNATSHWIVNFDGGITGQQPNSSGYKGSVRCVRRPAVKRCSQPGARYMSVGTGIVLDTMTGLRWQTSGPSTQMAWSEATSYCSALGGGYRLPSVNELSSLVDRTRPAGIMIDTSVFPGTGSSFYWTSSASYDPDPNPMFPAKWVVDFNRGSTSRKSSYAGSDTWYVRCVRDL